MCIYVIFSYSLFSPSLWFLSYPICLQNEWYQHWCHPPFLSKCASAISQNSHVLSQITSRRHCKSLTFGLIVHGLVFSPYFCLSRWHNLRSWFKCWKSLRTVVSFAWRIVNVFFRDVLSCIHPLFCFVWNYWLYLAGSQLWYHLQFRGNSFLGNSLSA